MKERLLNRIAWMLPARIVYFAAIRLVEHATTGPYGQTEAPAITAMDAIERWEKDRLK